MWRHFLLAALIGFSDCSSGENLQQPMAVGLQPDGKEWAETTLAKMSRQEKVGQLLMLRANIAFYNTADAEFSRLREAVQRFHVGGMLLSVASEGGLLQKSQPFEAAALTNRLQRESKLPLIFAADFERGLGMRLSGATGFPHAMAFAATGQPGHAGDFARVVAAEAGAIGVHLNFFPVADVASNPANPIINTRAYSENPEQVAKFVTAFVTEAKRQGLLTTAKHFPGHGNEDSDSHLGVARILSDAAHLETVELVPFRAAILAGVDAVMMAHVTVPALDPDPDRVATTSRLVATDLLRNRLGYAGLVVTDAMDMNAITRLYPEGRAAVEAIKAGNDVLLFPGDLATTIDAVTRAADAGEITWAQIDAAVLRLLLTKASVGLHRQRLVDPEKLTSVIARPENLALAGRIADEAVTLVRDNGVPIPLAKDQPKPVPGPYQRPLASNDDLLAVVFVDDVNSEAGRVFVREVRARRPGVTVMFVDPKLVAALAPDVLAAARRAHVVLAAAVLTPAAGKLVKVKGLLTNTVSLDDASTSLLHALLGSAAKKTVLVALGSPYLAAEFSEVQTYLCTFSNVSVSEVSAVKALFGEMEIHGRLPVTIPGVAAFGFGLDRTAKNPQ